MKNLFLRRRVAALLPILLVVLAFLVRSPAEAEGGQPAHYLVFELDQDGVPIPLFHRFIELAHMPESIDEEEMLAVRSRLLAGEPLLALELWQADGETAFRNVVRLEPWIRGEFHGQARSGDGWQIESYRFARQRPTFVVRVPRRSGTRLVLDGLTRSVFDLDALAGRADRLPLASVTGMAQQIMTLGASGDPGNRVDLLIMGDGYTSAADFTAAAMLSDEFFNVSPYDQYRNFVNVDTLYTPSAQEGADHPPFDSSCVGDDPSCCADLLAQSDPLAGTYVNTAFDGRFCAFNLHRLAVVNSALALAAAAAVPDWDHILMLLNDGTYGGSGGFPPVSSTHPLAIDIARHEYGHSFTDLAAGQCHLSKPGDVYCGPAGSVRRPAARCQLVG